MAASQPDFVDVPVLDMRRLIRAHDWAATPLGPFENWPAALRLAFNIMEHSAFPTAIYWGPELHLLYNDAWSSIPGERHPASLGKPAREVWSDIWAIVGPQFQQVWETRQGVSAYEQMLPMVRDGAPQETYWNYSFTPIIDEHGQIAGIFNQGNEITSALINERRLSFMVALADRLRGLSEPRELKLAAAERLGQHLGVARAGYGQIDEAQERVTVHSDWTRDPDVPSLAGESRILDAFGEAAIAVLRSGAILVIEDYQADPRTAAREYAATWEGIGTRSLIVVPLVRQGALKALLYLHEPRPRLWRRSEIALARDVAERTWSAVEQAESERRLRDSEDHYRHAVELNPQVSWTALPDGQLNRVSRRWFDWTGTAGSGESWLEGLHLDDVERSFSVWGQSVATGVPYDVEHRIKLRNGSYRWARSRAFPRRDADGDICLWYGTTEDIHEQKIAQEHQKLLINELNHRVKNTLATVQAIAFQTLKGGIPLAEARIRFEARLLALSRAHNMLTEQNWDGASLGDVVRQALGHLPRERFAIEGEPVWLGPRAALALALALHELGTNAVKYGALGPGGGKVIVNWLIDGDRLRLEWREQGGPAVRTPEARGFGSRLIERGLAGDLGGSARLRFDPEGVVCTIEAALGSITAKEERLG